MQKNHWQRIRLPCPFAIRKPIWLPDQTVFVFLLAGHDSWVCCKIWHSGCFAHGRKRKRRFYIFGLHIESDSHNGSKLPDSKAVGLQILDLDRILFCGAQNLHCGDKPQSVSWHLLSNLWTASCSFLFKICVHADAKTTQRIDRAPRDEMLQSVLNPKRAHAHETKQLKRQRTERCKVLGGVMSHLVLNSGSGLSWPESSNRKCTQREMANRDEESALLHSVWTQCRTKWWTILFWFSGSGRSWPKSVSWSQAWKERKWTKEENVRFCVMSQLCLISGSGPSGLNYPNYPGCMPEERDRERERDVAKKRYRESMKHSFWRCVDTACVISHAVLFSQGLHVISC